MLVFDSYNTSAESKCILTASEKESDGFGVFQSKTVCRFIGSVSPDRHSLADAFAGLVVTIPAYAGIKKPA